MRKLGFEDVAHLQEKTYSTKLHLLADIAEVADSKFNNEKKNSIENNIRKKKKPFSSSSLVLSCRHEKILKEKTLRKPKTQKYTSSCSSLKVIQFKFTGSMLINQEIPTNPASKTLKNQEKVLEKSAIAKSLQQKRLAKKYQGPPPEIPQCFKDKILELADGREVSEPILVVHKKLYTSDMIAKNNRFLLPKKPKKKYLYDHEKSSLPLENVLIIEPDLTTGKIKFDIWSIGPVLCGNWNQIVKRNKLALGMIMQLWAVRIDEELVFALVDVRGEIPGDCNDDFEDEKNDMED